MVEQQGARPDGPQDGPHDGQQDRQQDRQQGRQQEGPTEGQPDHRNQALGKYGEAIAARHLVGNGMVLLEQNFGTAAGEVDLLLRDGDVLVACEVKTRSSDACGLPHEAVDEAKVRRLRLVAEEWIAAHAADPRDLRVDLVAVTRPLKGPSHVEHVRGIG
jgi:putative endonuclease